ncbi:hypothetical protein [Mycobacteroides abscessus]|uniref:hypothetical protein n=1 Tax=Mycobacteroides abscessus TaxID=36809 RepID=UPI0009C6D846|nr:hypothetical protein [Mycobacteroides abscessus]MBN7442615.1 hypothetical protein [Mycobacteroides abscessus subsp. abscessus]SKR62357.1 integral membrane protein [Mycobacteroides abscessus subsp. abscessus]SLH64627.1 integral membrane protein [Mycobacteroides abscessus subsp. abscessus]
MSVAPWWVNWLAMVCLMTAVSAPMWLLMRSDSDTRGWLFFIVKVTAFSVGLATMFALIQQPVRRSFATALVGLNRAQRRQAATAISRGDIPRDPAVLSAAVRLATIALGVQRRAPAWAKWFQRASPILFLALAVGDFINGKHRHALAYTVFAVLLLVSVLWSEHVRNRMQSRLDLLHSAASAAGAAPPHSAADYPAFMSGRKQVLFAVAIGLTTASFAAAVTYFADQPNRTLKRDCSNALHGLYYFTQHKEMINGPTILSNGPSLSAYQDWSDEINRYAAPTPKGDIGAPMHRVASLSKQALNLVRDARNDPDAPQTKTTERQINYYKIINQMYDETHQVLQACDGVFH